jgi:hypothetical protein
LTSFRAVDKGHAALKREFASKSGNHDATRDNTT